jgi:two-component system, NtrC family, sensor kinase
MRHLIICFFLIAGHISAQKTIAYREVNSLQLVQGTLIEVLEDKTGKLEPAEVLASKDFKSPQQSVPNLGVSRSAFWLKFEVENQTPNDLLINLAYPNLDRVDMYLVLQDEITSKRMGKYLPFGERKYNSPSYIFDLGLKQNQKGIVLLRIESAGQIMAPLYLGDKEATFETVRSENLFVGIYSGVILIMFFYNLFIYFTVRDKVYIYYVAYIIVVGLVQVCLLGYTFQFLWPDSPWLAHHSVNLLSPISCIGIIEFIKVFLRTKELTPRLHKGFHVFTAVYGSYILADLFNLGDSAYNIIQLFAMLLSLYILIVAYKVMRLKYRPGRFLFFAWVIFLIGVFVYALKDVGVLPYNSITVLTMPVGSAIETALLSFALADRINILKM